ncbi:hypothetical protein ACSYAD_29575 [Acaryochloris marina NIES-2412]|uniref:hypothetical protein n=1 Tax=Acaryochloris marina TaxID=155978 RepID=UPI0040598634
MGSYQHTTKNNTAQSSQQHAPPTVTPQPPQVQQQPIQAKSNEEGLAEHAERLRKFQRLGNSMMQMGPPRVDNDKTSPLQPKPWIQRKLTIGEPGDKYEREAVKVTGKVVNQFYPSIPQTSFQNPMIQARSYNLAKKRSIDYPDQSLISKMQNNIDHKFLESTDITSIQREIDKSALDLPYSELVIDFEQALENDTLYKFSGIIKKYFSIKVIVQNVNNAKDYGDTFLAYKNNGEIIYGSGTDNLENLTLEQLFSRGLMLKIVLYKGSESREYGAVLHTLAHEYGVHASKIGKKLIELFKNPKSGIDELKKEKLKTLGALSAPAQHLEYAFGNSEAYNAIRFELEKIFLPLYEDHMRNFYRAEEHDIRGLRTKAYLDIFLMINAKDISEQDKIKLASYLTELKESNQYSVTDEYIKGRSQEEKERKKGNTLKPHPTVLLY